MIRAICFFWLIMIAALICSCNGKPPEETDPAIEPDVEDASTSETGNPAEGEIAAEETGSEKKGEENVEEQVVEGNESKAVSLSGSMKNYKIKAGDIT